MVIKFTKNVAEEDKEEEEEERWKQKKKTKLMSKPINFTREVD